MHKNVNFLMHKIFLSFHIQIDTTQFMNDKCYLKLILFESSKTINANVE